MLALKVVNFGTANSGLSTIGYTVYGSDGSVIGTRSTSGVSEIGTGTGLYCAKIELPDYDAIVVWDTGETPTRYAIEDYQIAINSIVGEVDKIQKIWNSIKNQGEFLAALMDRLGLIEKNEGLKKVDKKIEKLVSRDYISLNNIEEAFNRAAGKIKIDNVVPNITYPKVKVPDYSHKLNALDKRLTLLQNDINNLNVSKTIPSEILNRIEGIISSLKEIKVQEDDPVKAVKKELSNNSKNIFLSLGHKRGKNG